MSQKDLRERSGSVNVKSRLVSFLYDLMRDHLTAGQVEEILSETQDVEVAYTNGYLAQYAWDLAQRLSPNPFNQGGIVKDILRTNFEMVKSERMSPLEAADKVYAAITSTNPLLSTGKSRCKNETVDPLKVKEFESGFSKQSILEAEDERVLAALKEADQEEGEKLPGSPPKGLYGVFCEPLGHKSEPRWTHTESGSYESAVAEADRMNRVNKYWHYYAKPIR